MRGTTLFAIGLPLIAMALVATDAESATDPMRQATSSDTTLPRHIQLGARLGAVPDSVRARGAPAGAFVIAVVPRSPADAAGVRSGDVIVRIRSDSVVDVPSALAALKSIVAGGTNPIVVQRDGKRLALSFRAEERPRETSAEFAIDYSAVAAAGGKHRILITHPADGARHPAILIVGGIGCYSIDGALGDLAYRSLAYHLTRQGYTTVRLEKLGVGDSEGGPCADNTFEQELDGYRAALRAMRSMKSVDPAQLFVFGHSIGGYEAPLVASEAPDGGAPPVRGVIVLSTAGPQWYEYELANLRRQLLLGHMAPDSLEQIMMLKASCGFHFLVERESRAAVLGREPRCADHIDYPASDEYMQAVASTNVIEAWKRVTGPVLVMYGASDFITSRDEHLETVAELNAMHPGQATFAEIPELDHYLSRQASQAASAADTVSGLLRPYYGATLEPVLDRWLAAHSGQTTARSR